MRETISGSGNSIMVESWLATSRNVPGGEAWRNSPKEILTEPVGNWANTFRNGSCRSPPPVDLTEAAREAGSRDKTTRNGRAKVSSGGPPGAGCGTGAGAGAGAAAAGGGAVLGAAGFGSLAGAANFEGGGATGAGAAGADGFFPVSLENKFLIG